MITFILFFPLLVIGFIGFAIANTFQITKPGITEEERKNPPMTPIKYVFLAMILISICGIPVGCALISI